MEINKILCKFFGHKFSQTELLIFEIKNNPVNVENHGYYSITCPRCGEYFNPDPLCDHKDN